MYKKLGVFVISMRHGMHLEAILTAARRKRVQLHVHVSGSAVRLCLKREFQSVLAQTRVTICHRSAERLGIREMIAALYPGALTSTQAPPLHIHQCDRLIVL